MFNDDFSTMGSNSLSMFSNSGKISNSLDLDMSTDDFCDISGYDVKVDSVAVRASIALFGLGLTFVSMVLSNM